MLLFFILMMQDLLDVFLVLTLNPIICCGSNYFLPTQGALKPNLIQARVMWGMIMTAARSTKRVMCKERG